MWTICHPVCSTLSHRDSPVLDSRPLLSCSPFSLLPHPPVPPSFLPRCTLHPLTFYHHNRYIIPRSVFYSRVTSWNAFVRDIVRLSPSRLLLSSRSLFPILFAFFFPSSIIWSARERVFFFLFDTMHFFGFDYDAEIAGNYWENETWEINEAFCQLAFFTVFFCKNTSILRHVRLEFIVKKKQTKIYIYIFASMRVIQYTRDIKDESPTLV